MQRVVVLDTETTGLNRDRNDIAKDHRIIEIGCVEIVNGKVTDNVFHVYVNPERPIDPAATKIHGITDEFLKRKQTFQDVSQDLIRFISNDDVVIHNAPFDIAFLDKEFSRLPRRLQPSVTFTYIDTLPMARTFYPGIKNDLDSLRERLGIGGPERKNHNALLDARILAEVYLVFIKF